MNGNNEVKKSYIHLLYMGIVVCIAAVGAASGDVLSSLVVAIVGGGFFAATCLCKFNFFTVSPMVIVPPAVTYAVTRDITLTFMSLSFLPVGVSIFYCVYKRKTRSQTILASTASMALFYTGLYAVIIISIFGFINGKAVGDYVELNLDVVRESMEEAREIYKNSSLKEDFVGEEVFTPEFEETVIKSIRSSFAGYMLALFAISSFFATMLTKGLTKKKGLFPTECGDWSFVFSKPGAAVFILAYFVGSVYVSETEGPYLPFAINTLCISLYPAVLYMGISRIVNFFRRVGGPGGVITIIIGVLLFGHLVWLLVIIIGVFVTFSQKEKPVE